ncbi:MAG: 50S ribosomal protein L1 [Candidatus Doudnabacteria bacterium]|nr:50S ribosomal protein L1 [Candidatus Doudnabacteria bacterium]
MGKRFEDAKKAVNNTKLYTPEEAIKLAKQTATTKFVGNLEVHVRLGIDPKKTDQVVRSTLTLPHATGKTKKVGAFVTEGKEKEAQDAGAVVVGGEDLIKQIKEKGTIGFDVAIAEPAMMPKLAQIAKILGPKGLMPNPKAGTVTQDIGTAIKEYAAGKTEFKNDESGNVHMLLGKSDLDSAKLLENYRSFLNALMQTRTAGVKKEFVQGITLHATMGPAIKVKI